MVNEHLSADEIVWCEQLVQEIAAIVREEKQNDQLSMQNEKWTRHHSEVRRYYRPRLL